VKLRNKSTGKIVSITGKIQLKVVKALEDANGAGLESHEVARRAGCSSSQARGSCHRLARWELIEETLHSDGKVLLWDKEYKIMLTRENMEKLARRLGIPRIQWDEWFEERRKLAEFRGRQDFYTFSWNDDWQRLS